MTRLFLHTAASTAALLTTLISPGAQAFDKFQFDDSGEQVRILLNGNPISGSGGVITFFNVQQVPEPGGGFGEVILLDYLPQQPAILSDGTQHNLPYVYTQLYEIGPGGVQIVSDEFGIRPAVDVNGLPTGSYNMFFSSADHAWLLANLPPGTPPPTPSALSGLEINGYQDVGYLMQQGAAGLLPLATFQVSSVPEPESYAMLLAGLGALGMALRRRYPA